MKRWMCVFLVLGMIASLAMGVRPEVKITRLWTDELESIMEDVDAELNRHHEASSNARDAVLAATKEMTESYFSDQGIDVSWAWIDYTYTRDWDFYTLSTHIDYKDNGGNKQESAVYAEVLCKDGNYDVYYLTVDEDVVLDKRDELPNEKWVNKPESQINEATSLDLSVMTREELEELHEDVEDELKENHDPDSKIEDLVDSLAKSVVDAHYDEVDADVSWPWFDYTYTCDWGLYTYRAPVTIQGEDSTSQEIDVYAEAYPFDGQYSLTYLTVGEDVLIDRRSDVPDPLYPVEEGEDSEETTESKETAEPTDNQTAANGIRAEFKEAMDSYKAFYAEYCEFLKKYAENPTDWTLLAQYSEMLTKAQEMDEAFEAWDEDELSSEELKYYLDVSNEVMKMMVDVMG